MKEEVNRPQTRFKLVQTKIFQINKLLTGLSTFLPISFDREYTSISVCTLHGSIIDFRFRVKNHRTLHDEYKDGDTFMENGILVEKKYFDVQDELNPKKNSSNGGKWLPNNVAEYFFFDEFGFLSINERKILECYSEFTESMRIIYNNMRLHYNKFSSRILSDDDLSGEGGLDFPRVAREVEFMGLEHYLNMSSDKEKKEAIRLKGL